MEEEYLEKYATIPIRDLEAKVEKELFPSAFGICDRIEKEGKNEFQTRLKRFIVSECPLGRCAVLLGQPSKCPIPLCWIAEGPTWVEFLLPEINAIYSMLMDAYIEALDIPEDPDGEITFRDKPLDVMDRKLRTENTQSLIVKAFNESQILKPRANIIQDVLWAHNEGKYTLSAPLLIIQIEGILHDLAYHFKWRFMQKEMYRDESAKVCAVIEKLGDKPFENTLSDFYRRKKGAEESPRNLIVHGRSIDYGKDHRLSTVLFLILTYLITFSQMKIHGKITIE